MDKKAAFKAIVNGRVQGVFFRNFTQRKAQSLGITGSVRNLRNGTSVEVIAEGEKEQLENLVESISNGPPGAKVTSVDITWGDYSGDYDDFEISHHIDR